jgi:hypothetical protein
VAIHPGGRPVDPSLNVGKKADLLTDERREIYEDVLPQSLGFDGRPRSCRVAAFHQPQGEAATVDALYEGVHSRLLAEPERYSWRYILVTALLTRR